MCVIKNVAEVQRNRFHLIAEYWMTSPFFSPSGGLPREQQRSCLRELRSSCWPQCDFAVICVLYGFLHNQQINSLSTYYTPQWQRSFIILLMVILFVHNQERLQRKKRTVEMWMKILHNGTAFYNVPCMYTTIKKDAFSEDIFETQRQNFLLNKIYFKNYVESYL